MTDTKFIRKILLLLICCFLSICAHAQQINKNDTLRPGQLKSLALSAYDQGDIYSEIIYFEQYFMVKPFDYKLYYMLADAYRLSRNYPKAAEWYLATTEKNPSHDMAFYYYAQMLMMQGNYKKSKEYFAKFKKEAGSNPDAKSFKKLADINIAGCEKARPLTDSVLKVEITHLDSTINKAHVEFSPFPMNDSTMIYGSLLSDSSIYVNIDEIPANIPARQLYMARKINDEWESTGTLNGPFNIEGVNTGNGSPSPDGQRFYFTRCKKNMQGKVICSIYVSMFKDGKWNEAEPLNDEINLAGFTSTQPTMGKELKKGQDVLYFISDRPEGKGGLDLWYSVYNVNTNSYKEPKNAGSKINTAGDETTPYFDNELQRMYFSSDGWPGLGGLDVFRTTGEMNDWAEPENVGFPINSSFDDLYYVLHKKDKEQGFFTSNRPGGIALGNPTCCDDIYSFKKGVYKTVIVKGNVKDKNDTAKVVNATISVKLLKPNKEPYLVKEDTVDSKGNYRIKLEAGNEYNLTLKRPGYFNKMISLSTKNITDSLPLPVLTPLLPIPIKKAFSIGNIYYEFNSAELTAASKKTLDSSVYIIMQENMNFNMEVQAHTDNKGSDKYNQALSQRRAQSVVNYLVAKGIEKKRLIAKGYGESMPVEDNQLPDGKDNIPGMTKNRRTEFKIIKN